MAFINDLNGTFKIKLSDGTIPPNTAIDVTNSFGEIHGNHTILQNTLIATFHILANYHSVNDYNITHIGVFYNDVLIDILEVDQVVKFSTNHVLNWRLKII